MPQDMSVVAMFLVDRFGGVHCAGMCGGIVTALSASPNGTKALLHLAYSLGRVSSYSVAGAIAGSIGGSDC